jgi:protease-4
LTARRGIVLVILFIVFAIGVSAIGSLFFLAGPSAPPNVPEQSTLYLKIDPPFDEVEQLNLFTQFGASSHTLRSTIDLIRKAKADKRVKTLVIKPSTNGALWAQVQEVRAALVDFRKSGKPITAYLEYGGGQEYYIASAADRIVMVPGGMLGLTGHASYELFFKGALDKLGVYPDLLHIGDYKTWSNTFNERGFTPAHREMTESLNHDFYDQLVKGIAEGRKKSEAEIITAIDGGPYLAEDAKTAGLIDVVAWEDQLDDTAPIQGTRTLKMEDYARVPMSSVGLAQGQRIAVLYASGTIMSGESSLDATGGQVLGSETFVEWLRKVRVDPTIRAIIVRIDSPGGSAIASEVMWRELTLTRGLKPLIASMGNLAASGGYYIAAPADTIVAEPGTITGSIGVVTGKFVVKGTLDKLGIGEAAVSEGRMAQLESPFTPFSREERAKVEQQMHAAYDLFVARVAEGRKTTPERIDAVGQGRVWTGRQAQQLQLVDELGGLDTAIQIAKQRAKLDMTKDVQLVVYPPKRSVYDLLADPLGFATKTRLDLALLRRPEARVLERVSSIVQLFRRGEPLTLMPNIFWNN